MIRASVDAADGRRYPKSMKCQHCGRGKPDVKPRYYNGPGGAYRAAQRLSVLSAYFRTCDDCHQATADFASDVSRWLDEQFERLS